MKSLATFDSLPENFRIRFDANHSLLLAACKLQSSGQARSRERCGNIRSRACAHGSNSDLLQVQVKEPTKERTNEQTSKRTRRGGNEKRRQRTLFDLIFEVSFSGKESIFNQQDEPANRNFNYESFTALKSSSWWGNLLRHRRLSPPPSSHVANVAPNQKLSYTRQ